MSDLDIGSSAIATGHRHSEDLADPADLWAPPYHILMSQTLQYPEVEHLLAEGTAFVVQGAVFDAELWTPNAIVRNLGEKECTLFECNKGTTRKSTIANFFRKFGKQHSGCWKLKVRGMQLSPAIALPAPLLPRPDGLHNIAAHFPRNKDAITPDIGPKLYAAYKSLETRGGNGSTRLHMDMASAMNIMMWSSTVGRAKEAGTAVWDIYRPEHSSTIHSFLWSRHGTADGIDPIYSEQYYLDSVTRKQLYKQHGIVGYRIYQRPGDAVFVPAGCAHQVCNLADCIKIVVDFLSISCLKQCAKLTKEFQGENLLESAWKPDVLELAKTTFHAWNSFSQLCSQAALSSQTLP
ncbi:hypothetical protein FRB94_010934 [Tulasnella sp. JGI-2019a]|nr:hypothetical protein FRB93_008586 [Tulasnella sp. JGI-2019a]KAG8993242.1 hypothetical protein FRB94_010934 [Tulasnella sp. JGI-2019a]KAG9026528.1 hypothetical protein FRB95_008729 [Tulasnella sp. JGI-2019a]